MSPLNRHIVAASALLLALGLAPVRAEAPVTRATPEFAIIEPSGQAKALSSFKGQVVLLDFMLVNCDRCIAGAHVVDKLYAELGPRGFQPIALAFDRNTDIAKMEVFRKLLKIDYLFATTSAAEVDRYLGRAPLEKLQVPQLVLIDRAGMIRAQSLPVGDTKMLDEASLRQMILPLLDEAAPAGKSG